MTLVETAKDEVRALAGKVVGSGRRRAVRQTITTQVSVAEVQTLWRDPQRMSEVLGDLGDVARAGPDSYRWVLNGGQRTVWESRLVEGDGGLRFGDDRGHHLAVECRAAPNGLGTEVSLTAALPGPDLLAGAAAFTVLYRMRAQLQTGEVPTVAGAPRGH